MCKMSDTVIGQRAPRVDAEAKVTGRERYPGDLSRPDMLHMKLRKSPGNPEQITMPVKAVKKPE